MPDITIGRYQTIDVIPLETYAPGTIVKTMEIRGNAILSTIFIKSADPGATVKVNYFQTTSGTIDVSERLELAGHPLKDGADVLLSSQIIVTRIHNKPVVEYIVTGGDIEFGVYITVTDELASDIDSALVLDGSPFDPETSKAIPMACYDPVQDKVFFIRCEGGAIPVVLQDPGIKETFRFNGVTTPGSIQTIIDETLSATLRTFVRRATISCRAHGVWEMTADGVIIGSGHTGPSSPNDNYTFDIAEEIATSKQLKVFFRANSASPSIKLDCYVQVTQKT